MHDYSTVESLQQSGDSTDELVGRTLLFNWAVVGWCVGTITRRNKDARRRLEGQPYNFLVHYEIDNQEAVRPRTCFS